MDRLNLAINIVESLKNMGVVSDVGIKGSLANGATDRFSDIDIHLSSDSVVDRYLIEEVSDLIEAQFDLLFSDWARSFLPELRIKSYYLKNLPIFWNIDIEFRVAEEQKTITKEEIIYHPQEHYLKLWCLTLKHIHRRIENAGNMARGLHKRVLGTNETDGEPSIALMKEVLEFLSLPLPSKFDAFLSECEKELTLAENI